ncbi:transcription initiation factor TFIID subunit 4 [Callorhinchus milii]|uniref:Transcription initiation factor TFIID subunit 4-like n=2 Tax=Callorhinchus milii TaxID=7868 RepID=A0A4W3JAY9_CALMI|nr:transcription initiation factor TFIID subunit 4 [Callorhinchus milii]
MNPSNNQPHCTVTSSILAASSPVSINAMVKPAITVITQPHAGVTKAGTAAPITASQSQPSRPGIAAPQRVLTQQLIVRPQQQPTVQLAPGFTIPPGMILVRTESGQLVMVPQQALAQAQAQRPGNISPRPCAPTSGPTFRLTSTQQSMTLSSIRPAAPVQAKLITPTATPLSAGSATVTMVTRSPICVSSSSPQTVYTTAVAGVTGHHMSVQQTPAQQPSIAGGQPQASPRTPLQPQPATKLHTQVHLQPQVVPSSPLAGTAAVAQIPSVSQSLPLVRGGQEIQENVKKCKNFLATLIKLASHSGQSADTSRNVKGLVQDLLDAKIEPEEFTNRLQSELKSSPQPYLVPFLKKSLPALRQSLAHNQQSILQVHTPATAPSQATSTPLSTGTITAIVAGPTVRLRQPTTVAVTPTQISLTPGRSSHLIVQSPTQTVKRQSVSPGAQVRMPMMITPSIRPVGKTWPGSKSTASVTLAVSATQRIKHTDPGGGAFKDDDDINDVASMAGVNLSEESARILVTNSSLVGACVHSCKDEAFLASGPLHRRMLETAKRFGISDIPVDIVNTVSHATQERLKTVIGKLTSIAQHRMEVHKDEEWYEQATDVRTQLKFFEQLERLEKQRKDDLEREILLKAAKSRSRQEDPEQARLKQKAKEMQQQELAQMRQRDANVTALAAIGPRKKRKLDFPGQAGAGVTTESENAASTPGLQAGPGASAGRQYTRQRVTRVNLRDLIFYMEQEPETSHSLTLYRALLK